LIPYILTGFSLVIAGGIHWKLPNSFWKASLISTVSIVLISLILIFVFQSNYLGLDQSVQENGNIGFAVLFVAGLISFFSLLVSVLVGYFLKAIRP
jgi:amino acid transporter